MEWIPIRICAVVCFFCSAWNLLGDLYFMDFYTGYMSQDEFAMVKEQRDSGYLFPLTDSDGSFRVSLTFLAQSGGWMYPVWSLCTAYPVYLGMQTTNIGSIWHRLVPSLLLYYGMSIMGGALHNAFTFLTVLPALYHHNNNDDDGDGNMNIQDLDTAQSRIIQHIFFGSFPGYIACNVATIWIAVLVHLKRTRFPRKFNLFNPLVTTIWCQILAAILPDPVGFYFAGCLGTWSVLMLNMGTSYYLWNDNEASFVNTMPSSLETHLTDQATPDYKSVVEN